MVREKVSVINETVDLMDLNELKKAIIDRIQQLENVEALKDLLEIIEDMTSPPVAFTPTDKQMRQLEEAEAEIERGEYLTEEEANREIDEWLKKD